MAYYQDLGIRFVVLGFGELNRLNSTLAVTDRSIKNMSTSLTSWGNSLSNIGQQLTMSVTLPVLALGAGVLKAGIDFEDSFAGISKTVEGVSDDFGVLTAQGKLLAQEFRNLALEIPISVNELNKIGEIGGQLGVGQSQLAGFTETVAKLSVATNLTSEQAATDFARLANIMGISTDKISEYVLQTGNVVVELGNNAATTESEIMSLAMRIAGAGRTVGLTTPEILALSATLSGLGIQAELGGSAISRVFLEMKRATDDFTASGGQASDQLKLFAEISGMSVKAFVELTKNSPIEAFAALTKGLNEAQQSGKLTSDMMTLLNFDTIRLQDVLNRLGPNYEQLSTFIGMANDEWTDGNALQIEAQKKFNTTKSQIQLLKNAVYDLGISIFTLYDDDIKNLISSMKDAVTWFANLDDRTKKNIVSIAGLGAATGPTLMIFGRFLSMAGPLISILPKLAPAFGALASALPVLAPVAGAVGAGFFAIKTNLFGIGDLFETVSNWVQVITQDFLRFTGVIEIVKNAFKFFLAGDFATGLDLLKVAWDHVVIWFNTNGKELFLQAFQDIKIGVLQVLSNAASEIVPFVKKWIPVLVDWVQDAANEIIPKLDDYINQILEWIADGITYLAPKMAEWATEFVDWLLPAIAAITPKLSEYLSLILTWLGDSLILVIEKLLTWAAAFLEWLGPVIVEVLPLLGQLLGTILTWVITVALPAILSALVNLTVAFIKWLGDAIIKIGPELARFLLTLVNFILYDLVPAVLLAVYNVGAAIVEGIKNGIEDAWGDLEGYISGKLDSLGLGNITSKLPFLASGGPVSKPAIVGDQGPELFIPGRQGYVLNNQLTQLLSQISGLRSNNTNNNNSRIFAPNITGVPMSNEQNMSEELMRLYQMATLS